MSDMFGGLVILSAGTLYPAYSSYKAVKTKNTREYVKWMMYWIVFAFFNAITMFTDVFVSWFPGYYLFKTLFIIWLVSPATRGSTYLYKKVLHPTLRQNEEKIDNAIENIKERGYDYTSQYARLAMQNFSRSLMEAVFKGQVMIADQMQRQYIQQATAPMMGNSTDGRQIDQPLRSSAPDEGRLYRVDSQMFEMDDNYEDLDSDLSPARERRRKAKGSRPVSMPPPTIDEDLPYDEGSVSDPEYLPEPVEKPQSRVSKRQSSGGATPAATSTTKQSEGGRVTRSKSKKNVVDVTLPEDDILMGEGDVSE